ncbi:MAG: hypothetical protein FJ290_09225 [Planctomycetes bacterium]|nr:hypothetical protein [Planctomycetota bacterium]
MKEATDADVQEAFAIRDKQRKVRRFMLWYLGALALCFIVFLIWICGSMRESEYGRFLREQRDRDDKTAEELGITRQEVEEWRKFGKRSIVTKQDRQEALQRVERAKADLKRFLEADEATQAKELGITVEELRRQKAEAAALGH